MAVTPRWLPGLVCVVLYWVVIQSLKLFAESNYLIFMATFVGPMITALLFFVTWLGFSRRPWSERGFGMLMFVVTGALAGWLAHSTMKFGLILYGLPTLLTMWSVWSWVTRLTASLGFRRVTLALTMLVTASYYCLLRLDGVTGAMKSELSWRWSPTSEEKFLATVKCSTDEKLASTESASAEIVAQPGDSFELRSMNSVLQSNVDDHSFANTTPTVACNTGNRSVANHLFFVCQKRLRGDGCGSGRKFGRKFSKARTVSVRFSPA